MKIYFQTFKYERDKTTNINFIAKIIHHYKKKNVLNIYELSKQLSKLSK